MKTLMALAALIFFAASSPAHACDKSEVEGAFQGWLTAISSGDAAKIAPLYDPESAVLLPTLSPEVADKPEEREAYFKTLTTKKDLKATVNQSLARMYGCDLGIVSGIYTFSYTADDGKTVELPARFSFVFKRKEDGKDWSIVEHHSSKLPE